MQTNKEKNKTVLSSEILEKLVKAGYKKLTEIQEEVIPLVLEGKDLIGKSATGTGKTASFLIPIIQEIKNKEWRNSIPECLIVAPNRELAQQIGREAKRISEAIKPGISYVTLIGGMQKRRETAILGAGVQIVIGTPGRIVDHLTTRGSALKTKNIRYLVLDEADEMLKPGFEEAVQEIMKNLPKERQILLFSATTEENVQEFAEEYLKNPVSVEIKKKDNEEISIEQFYFEIPAREKMSALKNFLDSKREEPCIIFANTKRKVVQIRDFLRANEFKVNFLNSDLKQSARNKVLKDFQEKRFTILVATDVAARGIHVKGIAYVINFDYPQDPEFYIHRIGRTGRAGDKGVSLTMVSSFQEKSKLMSLCRKKRFIIKNLVK